MYGALWRLMPGPVWLRIILMLVLAVAVLALLLFVVFPWLNTFVNVNPATVDR